MLSLTKKQRLNKKGGWRILVTIASLLILVLVIFVFAILFTITKKNMQNDAITKDFSSLNTELALKTFLRSPVPDRYVINPYPEIKTTTYADLISWSCEKRDTKKLTDHQRTLSIGLSSIDYYFSKRLDKDKKNKNWGVKITYPDNKEIPPWQFGEVPKYETNFEKEYKESLEKSIEKTYDTSFLSGVFSSEKEFKLRFKAYASQVIPCKDGGFARITLFVDDKNRQSQAEKELIFAIYTKPKLEK